MDLHRDQLRQLTRSRRGLIVLDFYADWCGPCRMTEPILKELEEEKPNVLFCRIDADAEVALAMDFNVTSIPALFFLKEGSIVGSLTGLQPKEAILRIIEENE